MHGWRPTRASAPPAASRSSRTPATGLQVDEVCGDENSVGMIKFYRTACFTQIGGLPSPRVSIEPAEDAFATDPDDDLQLTRV